MFQDLHFDNRLAPGSGASIFNDWDVIYLICDTMYSVLNHVNANGGWSAFLWSKQGRVLDDAANPEGNNAPGHVERVYVSNGQIIYHLVKLYPSEPECVNPAVMQNFKIDLATLGVGGDDAQRT